MIESVYGIEPNGTSEDPSPIGGVVKIQYDSTGFDIGVGITLNRAGLEKYLRDNPEPKGIGNAAHPDNGIEFYTRLERGQTNRLIRLLRKARDASFGRDE